MASEKLSSIIGGGGIPKLAPDLAYPTDILAGGNQFKQVVIPVVATVKTTALSLTGKFLITYLNFSGLINESMTFDLTIDGVLIWSGAKVVSSLQHLLLGGAINIVGDAGPPETIQCDTSLLLEITTTTDTSVVLNHNERPIL